MAPKLWKGSKGKARVLKKPAAAGAKVVAPSAIKGLAGFRKASGIFTGAVDKGVFQQNASLASRARVLEDLDARLVCIDSATNIDKYYVLQGLEDSKVPAGKPKRCYAYQRWGRTGTGGMCRLQGPMERKKVETHLMKVFQRKTGIEWSSLKPGEKAMPGKYWLAVPSEADPRAIWEYCVDDGVDKKSKGWYPYDSDAVKQVEELHAEHVANKSGKNLTAERFVASGKFTYRVDFQRLSQLNTSSGTERKIRRTVSSQTARPDPPRRQASASPCEASSGLFRADTAQTLPALSRAVTAKTIPGLSRAASAETIPAAWNDAVGNAQAAQLGLSRAAPSASSVPGLPLKRARQEGIAAPTSNADMRRLAIRGEIGRLSIPVLKSWLSSRAITSSGQKSDLVDRVYCLLEE